jgi:hypothetical protein
MHHQHPCPAGDDSDLSCASPAVCERYDRWIREAVAAAPPLTDEQLRALARLLRAGR